MSLNLPEYAENAPSLAWKRILAFLIDIMVINFVVLLPFRSYMKGIFPKEYNFSQMYAYFNSNPHLITKITIISIFISFIIIAYFVAFEYKFRQSIGKKLMNLYVSSQAKDIRLWQHLVRNIVFLPVFPFILLWLIDPLFMFFSKSRQTLTEILSRTEVKNKSETPANKYNLPM